MSGSPRRRMPVAAGQTGVERLETERFARKLYELLLERDMTPSDLARLIWGSTTDKRGYDVARNRDRISVYLAGKSVPDPLNLKKIADALGVPMDELAPDITGSAVERENPEIGITAVSGHPEKVYLRVNKLVTMTVAAKVMTLLSAG